MEELLKIKKRCDEIKRIHDWIGEYCDDETIRGFTLDQDLSIVYNGNIKILKTPEELGVNIKSCQGLWFVDGSKLKSTKGFPLDCGLIVIYGVGVDCKVFRPKGYTGSFFNYEKTKGMCYEICEDGEILDGSYKQWREKHKLSCLTMAC